MENIKWIGVLGAIVIVGGILYGLFFGVPEYFRYQSRLSAQNELVRQESLKKVAIEQSKAEAESAILRAQGENDAANLKAQARVKQATAESEAEVARAKGVAEANKIIADSLQGNEAYLRYLWIDKLSDNPNVIYVPTEAGLPLLEAGKR